MEHAEEAPYTFDQDDNVWTTGRNNEGLERIETTMAEVYGN